MAIQRSHAHLSIIIGGHRFVSFADEDEPYEITFPELRDGSVGADGAHYARAVPDRGCKFLVRLSDISPSLQWCIQQRTLHLNATFDGTQPIPVFEGSITDLSFNISATMRGMTLDGEFPGFPKAAMSTNEVMFDVEQIVSSVDGGAFEAPLTAVATA